MLVNSSKTLRSTRTTSQHIDSFLLQSGALEAGRMSPTQYSDVGDESKRKPSILPVLASLVIADRSHVAERISMSYALSHFGSAYLRHL